mmetsp:Transcript_53322/g.59592  ORF Transcript_53322/g.59592 Transcript_53322/m.59592 type:complete len:226 (+) Transcript_53322:31-708(+)
MASKIFQRLPVMNITTIPSFFSSFGTIIAISPIFVWAHDTFFSFCRIQGESMEPTLFCGDIVVVRKSDGFWQRWTRSLKVGKEKEQEEEEGKVKLKNNDNNEWAIERGKILLFEKDHCNSNGYIGLLKKPPIPITGDIVVYKDPEKYPDQLNVNRVSAIGGQTVRTNNGITAYVPAYKLWVEGDNPNCSRDNRYNNHGPVSKKLLVGVAEYRVWPPWRIGKLDKR